MGIAHADMLSNHTVSPTVPPVLLECGRVLSIQTASGEIFHEFSGAVDRIGTPIILAILCVLGIVAMFFGARLIRLFLFLATGGAIGGILFLILSRHTCLDLKWRILACGIVGIAGGVAAIFFLWLAVVVAGGYFGFLVSTFFLTISTPAGFTPMKWLDTDWKAWLFVAGFCAIGAAIAAIKFCRRVLLVLLTAFGGAFLVCLFLDHWANTGFSYAVETILRTTNLRAPPPKFSAGAWGFLVMWIALAVIGAVAQLYKTSRNRHVYYCKDNDEQHGGGGLKK
eukprot:NODE_673_length_1257_cov_119.948675_g536_i0.p1 GENE.NODE_673_length_1257_cov_119.948675_g536_i0~~NODE_673_length_1257_cov_119.948675_g536_i0.p1  ORF type:complete len:289 (+),score=62.61 NODE_673_length_1257_cov_119.948675_g536_i0:24-869(+)